MQKYKTTLVQFATN